MPIINVPEVLRKKLEEDGTDAFVDLLNQVEQSAKENSIGIVSERFERRLSEEMAKLRSEDLAQLKGLISESHVKTVRWLFAFWTAQTAAVIGLFLHLK